MPSTVRVLASLLVVAFALAGGGAQAQAPAPDPQSRARERHDAAAAELARQWRAVQQASPEFSRLFCAGAAPRNGVCVPDWEGFRSPVGGWRLVDPGRCEVALRPCALGSRFDPAELDLAARPRPPLPPGTIASWLPCDVFPDPGDPSTLKCDDVCGCAILKANCAGKWNCSTLPDECSCSP